MNLAELISSAQQLDEAKTKTTKPELEIIIQSTGAKKSSISPLEFINIYTILLKEAKKQPLELMVDKLHSNIKDDSTAKFNNTRVTNFYMPKENEPGYKRVKMIYIIKKRFQPYEGEGFKVVLSTEEAFEKSGQPSESSSNDYARIKVRTPFVDWPKAPGWKIDITSVFGMPWNHQINYMKKVIEKCFDAWKDPASISAGNLTKFNSFEVEAEFVGDYDKLTEKQIVDTVTSLNNIIHNREINENDDILYREVSNIATLIGHSQIRTNMTVKKVSAMPFELNYNTWRSIFPPLGWYVTDKADGTRTIIHLHDTSLIILSDSAKVVNVGPTVYPRTIVDCEEVAGKYYIFDVLFFKDANVSKLPFQRRYEELEPAAKYLAETAKLNITAKPFNRFPLIVPETAKLDDELRPTIENMWERTRPYEIDGLIFNSPDANYLNTKMFKWKPRNSIDFLAMKCPATLLGPAPYLNRQGHTLYLLFVTIAYDEFRNLNLSILEGYEKIFPQFSTRHGGEVHPAPGSVIPIQFSPSFYPRGYIYYTLDTESSEDLNNQIIELYVDTTDSNTTKIIEKGEPLPWKLLHIRHDRQTDVQAGGYFGNYIKVAEEVAQNIINPFPLDALWSTKHVYFQEEKDPIYNSPTHFNSFVKAQLFTALKPDHIHRQYNSKAGNVLLDMAAGRGADIGRYSLGGFTLVVAADNDNIALSELARRKYSKHFKNIPSIFTVQFNFNSSINLADHFKNIGLPVHFDAISCNFAIHYVDRWDSFARLINSLLKVGGRFGFTCFDGAKVNTLLTGRQLGESWVAIESGFVKYQLQKMYIGDKLENHGQIINVKLPFTEELFSENLVNIGHLLEVFAKHGIHLKERKSFSDFRPDFLAENQKDGRRLTEDDILYTGLYEFVILEKTLEVKGKMAEKK